MFSSKRALVCLTNFFIHANPRCYHSRNSYEACFSSVSHKIQGGTTPGDLSQRDTTVISNIDDKATESSKGSGHSGCGDMNIGNKPTTTKKNGEEKHRGRRRREEEEDMSMEDAGKDTAGAVAQMAKAGAVGALETGLTVGEMAKQTADNMWKAAKKATESVRDSVADDDSHESDRRMQTSNKNHVEDRYTDKYVEDLRRRTGGYDLKDH